MQIKCQTKCKRSIANCQSCLRAQNTLNSTTKRTEEGKVTLHKSSSERSHSPKIQCSILQLISIRWMEGYLNRPKTNPKATTKLVVAKSRRLTTTHPIISPIRLQVSNRPRAATIAIEAPHNLKHEAARVSSNRHSDRLCFLLLTTTQCMSWSASKTAPSWSSTPRRKATIHPSPRTVNPFLSQASSSPTQIVKAQFIQESKGSRISSPPKK